MVAYKQHANLRAMLVRAKLPNGASKSRKLMGMKKCQKGCIVCPYLKLEKDFKSHVTRERINLRNSFNCRNKGVIYLTECSKCGIQYLRQTTRMFNERIREHRLDIINKKDTANAKHYNSKGHCLSDFRAMIIEIVVPNDGAWLLEREDFWIKRLETKSPKGLIIIY